MTPGSPEYEAMIAERDELRAEVERLREARDKFDLEAQQLDADNERLRALLQKLRWKSTDKDNMEFRCDITCYVMEEMRAALEQKP
jgi:predicted nuclease with TOPRIM domain